MNIILFDTKEYKTNLLPLTYTRPVAEIRIGILTISQKWKKRLNPKSIFYFADDYLKIKFPFNIDEKNLFINASLLPDNQIIDIINNLPLNSVLTYENENLIFFLDRQRAENFSYEKIDGLTVIDLKNEPDFIRNLWDIFTKNGQEIEKDFKLLTKGRVSQPLSKTNIVFEEERIFVEPGVSIEGAVLNPVGGYIYIGKDALIMEGSVIRGSLALCEHSQLKIGAKIYGPTTIGPYSKVGGEVNNSVIFGYSNKAHDGFLGNSVLGEWCNLGAGTNNSNLKNNYAEVKLWNYANERFVRTGLQFCGLIMGDHSKAGINTMFNTGTVVGVSANIFGAGFPRNFIPSFSWGGAAGFSEYNLKKALQTAEIVMARRNKTLDEKEISILQYVFEQSKKFRH